MSIKTVELAELRKMENTEGLLLQGCGGDLKEWLDGINNMFQEADILLENTKFEEDDCLVFKNGEITCLLLNLQKIQQLIWRNLQCGVYKHMIILLVCGFQIM